MKPIYKTFLCIIVFLSFIDIGMTWLWVKQYGLSMEANPIVRGFIGVFGTTPGLMLCLAITMISVAVLWVYGGRCIQITFWASLVILISKVLIVGAHGYCAVQVIYYGIIPIQ